MIKNVLIPVDGSEYSKTALDFACKIADKKNATLHLLHVAQPPPGNRHFVLGGASITVPASQEELDKAGRQATAAAEDLVRGRALHLRHGALIRRLARAVCRYCFPAACR